MPGVIEQNIFIRLDDPDALVPEMFLEPIGFYQRFGMRVLRRMRSHRTRKLSPLFDMGKRISSRLPQPYLRDSVRERFVGEICELSSRFSERKCCCDSTHDFPIFVTYGRLGDRLRRSIVSEGGANNCVEG